MNKLFLLFALLSFSAVGADEKELPASNLITKDIDTKRFNPRASHWISTFGFDAMKWSTTHEFTGVKKSFKPGQQELWGGHLGFGWDLHLGAGLLTTTNLSGYYMGTLFARAYNADPDYQIQYASTKRTAQNYGFEATQAISYAFDLKTKHPFLDHWTYLTIEPFAEAGIGVGEAMNRVDYIYDTTLSGGVGDGTTPHEEYRHRMKDTYISRKVGAGINFTASSGFFLQLKVSTAMYDVTKRSEMSYVLNNGDSSATTTNTSTKNAKIDPITIYTLGGGYKF